MTHRRIDVRRTARNWGIAGLNIALWGVVTFVFTLFARCSG